MREAWIIDGVRTPRGKGKPNGALNHFHPQALLAQTLNALIGRVGIEAATVDDVVVGCSNSLGEHAQDIARLAALAAGWPWSVPGVTLDRFCGSGQQAVTFAAQSILAGHQQVVIGGGIEMMSRYSDPPAYTLDGSNAALRARHPMIPAGISADLIATLETFDRVAVDEFAVKSQQRAEAAIAERRFDKSLYVVRNDDGSVALDHDENPRAGTTLANIERLTPSFEGMGGHVFDGYDMSFDAMAKSVYPQVDRVSHVHTAGNSSTLADGASAILLASSDFAKAHGLKPRARIRMTAVAGSEPVIMLTAPGPAAKKCLAQSGMTAKDIDLWEVNEAFAAVALRFIRDLDLDIETVNVNGGAIALGHPIGATGPMLIQTALDELERRDLQTALITMCTGGGMGTATIIERC